MIFLKYKMTSKFGQRVLANGDSRQHNGIDLVGVGDIQVHSPIKGIVVQSRIILDKSNPTWEFGNYVAVRSSDGFTHYFCHLANRSVKLGDSIDVGQIIGTMGNTGYSFGAHTHYGIKNPSQVWIDPLKYHNSNIVENKIYTVDFSNYNRVRVQQRFGFDDNTMKFFDGHPYASALYEKLATMK